MLAMLAFLVAPPPEEPDPDQVEMNVFWALRKR